MAKNKAYTDIEQSKKLAKILPKKSADMWYIPIKRNEKVYYDLTIHYSATRGIIPAWSLAALLDVIDQVKEITYQRVTILVGRYVGNHWYVELLKVQDEKSVLLVHYKELVDACVEMVVKLKELKLL